MALDNVVQDSLSLSLTDKYLNLPPIEVMPRLIHYPAHEGMRIIELLVARLF